MQHPVALAAMILAMTCTTTMSQAQTPAKKTPPAGASADLLPTQGNQAAGMLKLVADGDGVKIVGTIKGLEPNSEHGFHVHEKGDCSAPDASSAGGHFNPGAQMHGNPGDANSPHHLGDVPSIRADAKGIAKVDVKVSAATLGTGQANDIVGKALVVHEKPDDYKTQPSGNSGSRIACGVIK